jgi:hypothetical protein
VAPIPLAEDTKVDVHKQIATILTGETRIPLEAMVCCLENLAPELAQKVVGAVMSRMDLPAVLTGEQREEIELACVENFKEYFLSGLAIAHLIMVRGSSGPAQ